MLININRTVNKPHCFLSLALSVCLNHTHTHSHTHKHTHPPTHTNTDTHTHTFFHYVSVDVLLYPHDLLLLRYYKNKYILIDNLNLIKYFIGILNVFHFTAALSVVT